MSRRTLTERVPPGLRRDLEHLLEETADAGVTRTHVDTPEARQCIQYIAGNRHRMRYPQFRAQGLCVSSGVVEAGCKQIGARLKRAGMRWTVAGANAILALRCCILSGRLRGLLGATSSEGRLTPSNNDVVHPS